MIPTGIHQGLGSLGMGHDGIVVVCLQHKPSILEMGITPMQMNATAFRKAQDFVQIILRFVIPIFCRIKEEGSTC